MKGSKSSLRYAKAILNLAKQKQQEAQVDDNMRFVVKVISENKDLGNMLKSPIIKNLDKKKVLNALFSNKVSPILVELFTLLEQNKRIDILVSIANQYSIIYNRFKKIQKAKVTTAVSLTKTVEQKIKEKIIQLTGNSAAIENEINPNILGGFILQIADVQYDASILNYFKQLDREFDNSH